MRSFASRSYALCSCKDALDICCLQGTKHGRQAIRPVPRLRDDKLSTLIRFERDTDQAQRVVENLNICHSDGRHVVGDEINCYCQKINRAGGRWQTRPVLLLQMPDDDVICTNIRDALFRWLLERSGTTSWPAWRTDSACGMLVAQGCGVGTGGL